MDGQISFEATSVKIEPLRDGKMFVVADFNITEDFAKSFSFRCDINFLNLIPEELVVKCLEYKGYYVTHEKDRA